MLKSKKLVITTVDKTEIVCYNRTTNHEPRTTALQFYTQHNLSHKDSSPSNVLYFRRGFFSTFFYMEGSIYGCCSNYQQDFTR